ncbi:biotin/lipoyl-containing protein [Nannocystis pusilla]|uniref:biotin/lipoyl-containing protein n=1 Tax=Nannocystis pusilla TaxID=889268 RepID=UPI003B7797BD
MGARGRPRAPTRPGASFCTARPPDFSAAGERVRRYTSNSQERESMIDVVMPQLGEDVAEGTVSQWFVREGQYVTRDQVLLEVETSKADTEIPRRRMVSSLPSSPRQGRWSPSKGCSAASTRPPRADVTSDPALKSPPRNLVNRRRRARPTSRALA